MFRALMIYLKPVLPSMAAAAEQFFNESAWSWSSAHNALLGTKIEAYQALATRLDPKEVMKLVNDSTPAMPATKAPAATAASSASDKAMLAAATAVEGNLISVDELARVDLRIAKILHAELVEGADKLLRLEVDVGELGRRQIYAGLRQAYDPATLVGRMTIIVANLEPRKMRFGVSEGMVLAAGPGARELFILSPDNGATPGSRVK
jgi:methionyl-tRNA synthetase